MTKYWLIHSILSARKAAWYAGVYSTILTALIACFFFSLIILVNKWDLVKNKETNTARDFEAKLRHKLAPFNDVPILFISVLEKQRIHKALDLAMEVYERRTQKIKTSELNEILLAEIERKPPAASRGRLITIKYITQLPLHYPAFAFFCNHPDQIKGNYKGFLENRLRAHFDFTGVPISIFFRAKSKK